MKQINAIEVDKMLQLADFLETVPVEGFNLFQWTAREERPRTTSFFGLIERDPGCGYAGCAMGWAAHSGLFEGLKLVTVPSEIRRAHGGIPVHNITYKGYLDMDAAAKLFGITARTAYFFFHPQRYETKNGTVPGQVSERLRAFVDKVDAIKARTNRPGLRLVQNRAMN